MLFNFSSFIHAFVCVMNSKHENMKTHVKGIQINDLQRE